ncbi:MAG: VanW family protein, partial [Patescibacteria group bacterium]
MVFKRSYLTHIGRVFLWAFCFSVLLITAYHLIYSGRIYPGIKVAGIDLSGRKPQEAEKILNSIQSPNVSLVSENPKIEISLSSSEVKYNVQESVNSAFLVGRTGSLKQKTKGKIYAITYKINLPFVFNVDQVAFNKAIASAQDSISLPPTEPSVTIEKNVVVVNIGKDGIEVEKEELVKKINETLAYNLNDSITIPTKVTKSHLTDIEAELIKVRAEKLLGKSLRATVEYQAFTYPASELVSLLAPEGAKEEKLISVVENIAKAINRPPQDARLVFENEKVREFAPGKDGLETNQKELKNLLEAAIENLIISEETVAAVKIPVSRTLPQIATGDVNNLGIKELIGRGSSRFAGSIPSRIHNVELAASRINGLLIKPGDTFSFNSALGEVSANTGFQQAYVIQSGRTVLGDGGGVCQVSTTLFRATLNAGLPIIERRAHSYRVGYYEQDSKPGIDATVYDPTTDFKFKNDTTGHILIQTIFSRKSLSLVFELYGTSDGRVSTISTPRVWDFVPAPPDLYQEDPTLAPGTKKQV